MKIRKTRLDENGKFVDQTDMEWQDTPQTIKAVLGNSDFAMITFTFNDGRETLWSKLPDMTKSRPMQTIVFGDPTRGKTELQS